MQNHLPLSRHDIDAHFHRDFCRPHPVCAQRHTSDFICQRCPNDICQRFGNSQHRSFLGINQCSYRRMTDGCGNSSLPLIIQRHHSDIVQRQLQLAGTLLFGNKSACRAVNFVGYPVFASHRFKLQDNLQKEFQVS